MGVKDVSMQDIDIAHRVPARKASSRPNPIICKFVRRQVKERVVEIFLAALCDKGFALCDFLYVVSMYTKESINL